MVSYGTSSHLCNERYIRVELTPLLRSATLGYMMPFEPGISPKCTILKTVPIDAHSMRYSRNLIFYPEICICFGINTILINYSAERVKVILQNDSICIVLFIVHACLCETQILAARNETMRIICQKF